MNGDTDGRLCGSDCVNGDTDGRVAAPQPGGWGGDRDRSDWLKGCLNENMKRHELRKRIDIFGINL